MLRTVILLLTAIGCGADPDDVAVVHTDVPLDTGAPYVPPAPDAVDLDDDGSLSTEDCDDGDPTIYPDADDVWYDGIDQDSDGNDDDQDEDGVAFPADCDDTAPETFPGAPDELYDGIDQDCDGLSDF